MGTLSSATVVDAYRHAVASGEEPYRLWLREAFPGLKMEFDAIDQVAEKQQRMMEKRP